MAPGRPRLLLAVLAVHIALIAAAFLTRRPVALHVARERSLLAVQLPQPSRSVHPAMIRPRRPVPPATTVRLFHADAPSVATCDIAAAVQGEMATDDRIKQWLSAFPVADRSVANTIMLWDGSWHAQEPSNGTSDQPRASIVAVLQDQPANCLDEVVAGPRLLLLEDGASTASLMIGSGQWRWRDLLSDTPDDATGSGEQASLGSHQLP